MTPGAEMKKAILLSKKHKTRIALIDQDIRITLKKLSKEITFKEKFRFLKDLCRTKNLKKEIKNFDLTKVPDKTIIKELTNIVKKRYPATYKVLIKERDLILAKNLNNLITNYPDKKILAIVGAGHEESILKYLKKNEKK
jgi:pheromone shutdown protein TraB